MHVDCDEVDIADSIAALGAQDERTRTPAAKAPAGGLTLGAEV